MSWLVLREADNGRYRRPETCQSGDSVRVSSASSTDAVCRSPRKSETEKARRDPLIASGSCSGLNLLRVLFEDCKFLGAPYTTECSLGMLFQALQQIVEIIDSYQP